MLTAINIMRTVPAMPTTPGLETPKPTLLGSWQVDRQASHARFVARTLAGLVKTPGRFHSLSGNLVVDGARTAGALVIDATSIDTGNRMRDRHLRSRAFFGVKRHPELRYEVRSISTTRVDGQLVVGDVRVPLALDVTVRTPADGVVELACRTEVDRLALGIRGARGMVPRMVELDVVLTLRRTAG
jgi:polyisoprenoid-binding protein YceI